MSAQDTHRTIEQLLPDSPILDSRATGAFARATIRIAFLGLAAFLLWAYLTPLRETVVGQGVVLPEGSVQRVEHLEGGIVGTIHVTEGQSVLRGETIVTLDQAALRAELRRVEARAETLAAEIARHQDADLAVGPTGALDGASDIARSQRAAKDEAAAHLAAQLQRLRSEVDLREAEKAALRNRRIALAAELAIVSERFRRYDVAFRTNGAISGAVRDEAALEKLRLEREIAQLGAETEAADLRIRMAGEQEAEARARARETAALRIAELEGARAEVGEELARLREALGRGALLAPVSGRILTLATINPGQVLAPGAVVAEIVPADATLFVEVRLPAEQIGEVSLGMEARVKATAFDYMRFGDVAAVVDDISASSIPDAEGLRGYRLRLRLSQPFVGNPSTPRFLAPGMTVTAELRGKETTVLEQLMRPLRVLRDRALTET